MIIRVMSMHLGRSAIAFAPFFVFAILTIGCSPRPQALPAYQWAGDEAALRTLAERAHAVKSLSAASLLTLTRADGNSVRLDGAIVLSLPEKSVRLRAWKFDQPVFDLTLNPSGLWIKTPSDPGRRQQVLPASVSAGQLARALSVFGGEVFEGPGVRVIDSGGPRFSVRKQLENGQSMTAEIDRATLSVLAYRLANLRGTVRFGLRLERYQKFQDIYWPTRLIAQSDSGSIDAELRDVELNGQLPPGAFIPPRGAEKLP